MIHLSEQKCSTEHCRSPEDVSQQRQPPAEQLAPLPRCEGLEVAVEDEAGGVQSQGGQEGAPGPGPANPQGGQVHQRLAEVEDLTHVSPALNKSQ